MKAATTRLSLLALAMALSACSTSILDGDKIDYKSAAKGSSLEVPPDLTQLSRDSRYAMPGGSVSAAAMQAGQAAQPSGNANAAALQLGDVRIERDGNQRWLVVNRPADKLWEPVRDFWLESGFTLAQSDANVGIMETDWAENRAKLPQDFIRSTIGKLMESLYSTGERDKFRTRLERNANGSTEIYITHRGMVEVYGNATKDSTVWQPRPSDPELETEFLRRLMVKLGVSQEQSKAVAVEWQPALPHEGARMAATMYSAVAGRSSVSSPHPAAAATARAAPSESKLRENVRMAPRGIMRTSPMGARPRGAAAGVGLAEMWVRCGALLVRRGGRRLAAPLLFSLGRPAALLL